MRWKLGPYEFPDPYMYGLSDCCGAKVLIGEYCADCHDHCGIVLLEDGDAGLSEGSETGEQMGSSIQRGKPTP